jgi:uncharacterized metal-binding protein
VSFCCAVCGAVGVFEIRTQEEKICNHLLQADMFSWGCLG